MNLLGFNTSITYKVETEIHDAKIKQTVYADASQHLYQWIIDTREKQFIEALIRLGWTPPNEPINS